MNPDNTQTIYATPEFEDGDPRKDSRPWEPCTLADLRPRDLARWEGAYGIICMGVISDRITSTCRYSEGQEVEGGKSVYRTTITGGHVKGTGLHRIPGPAQEFRPVGSYHVIEGVKIRGGEAEYETMVWDGAFYASNGAAYEPKYIQELTYNGVRYVRDDDNLLMEVR